MSAGGRSGRYALLGLTAELADEVFEILRLAEVAIDRREADERNLVERRERVHDHLADQLGRYLALAEALEPPDDAVHHALDTIGFDRPLPIYNVGTLCEGMYTETKEAGQRSEAAIDKFAPGQYHCLLVAPLERATFEPHVVCVYANPAQVMRLVQAALWKRGGRLPSSFEGRAVCADIIVTTMKTGEPQVVLPCSGDRIFGQTQDHEMAFSIPWARMEEILEGLRGTHAGGIRSRELDRVQLVLVPRAQVDRVARFGDHAHREQLLEEPAALGRGGREQLDVGEVGDVEHQQRQRPRAGDRSPRTRPGKPRTRREALGPRHISDRSESFAVS